MDIALVPAPLLRNKPALTNCGTPELKTNELPPPCSSKFPAGALLNTPALQTTWPAVHVPAPPLTSVPPLSDLLSPLSVIPPLAKTFNVDPAVPKNPPVQEKDPETVIAMVP